MKIQCVKPNQSTFKAWDNDPLTPSLKYYDWENSVQKLYREGYLIQGDNNYDAFERLHNDINSDLVNLANSPKGVWSGSEKGVNLANKEYMVFRFDRKFPKEYFAKSLTDFWETMKNSDFSKLGDYKLFELDMLDDYFSKKGLYCGILHTFIRRFNAQDLSSNKKINLDALIRPIAKTFLKTGQHKLK